MRKARFRIWRLLPPFTRSIEVHRITVGQFAELLRTLAPKVAEVMLRERARGRNLSDLELIYAAADNDLHAEVAAAADLLCLEQPVGFLRGWLHGRLGGAFARINTARLLAACRAVEGDGQWTRFLGCLNRQTGKPEAAGKKRSKAEGGGMAADVETMARLYGVIPDVIEAMELQSFLNRCDAILRLAEMAQPDEPDPNEPISVAELQALDGGAVFH